MVSQHAARLAAGSPAIATAHFRQYGYWPPIRTVPLI